MPDSSRTSGAQPGNRNAAKSKPWAAAIDRALKQFNDKKLKLKRGQALNRIAYAVIRAAIGGDLEAVREIGDRLDGKPRAAIEGEIQAAVTMIFDDPTRRPPNYQRRPRIDKDGPA